MQRLFFMLALGLVLALSLAFAQQTGGEGQTGGAAQTGGQGQQQTQDQATVQVAQSEEYGAYLTDAQGRTLYLFVDEEMEGQDPEQMTEGVREAAAECSEECLQAWPPFTAEGEVQAGEGLNPELLYVASVDGRNQVVYNGWPLYYFVRDEEPGQINGQEIESFGGEWYIVSPEGTKVEAEEEGNEGTAGGEGQTGGEGTGGNQ